MATPTHLTLVPQARLQKVIEHAIGRPLLILKDLSRDPYQEAVAVRGAKGGTDLLGDHLGFLM